MLNPYISELSLLPLGHDGLDIVYIDSEFPFIVLISKSAVGLADFGLLMYRIAKMIFLIGLSD